MSIILKSIGVIILGALGALVFVVWLLPYMLVSPYFANYQFVKDFKQGKIVVNQKEYIYIQENTALQSAIERVKNSVVTIQGQFTVPGLIATSDGNIITLASAVGAYSNVDVFLGGEKQIAKVIKVDYKDNLALLKIEKSNLQTVAFTDLTAIKLGQKVFLVAPTSAKQDNWFIDEGIIGQINVLPDGSNQAVKTNIAGTSITAGSALFNLAGQLVGLNFIDAGGKISAIPVNKIQALMGL